MLVAHPPRTSRRIHKADFADAAPDVPAWTALHAVADANRQTVQDVILDDIAGIRASLPADDILAILARGDSNAVLDLMAGLVDRSGLEEAVRPVLRDVMTEAALTSRRQFNQQVLGLEIPQEVVQTRVPGDLITSRAALQAEVQAARLVREVTDSTRRGIAEIVKNGLAQSRTTQQIAVEIRGVLQQVPVVIPAMTPAEGVRYLKDLVGLTQRQVAQVERFRQGLVARGIHGERLEKAVARKGVQLLKRRALVIARTETIDAAAAGQLEFYEASVRAGLLDVTRARKRWVVTPDDSLCPTCRAIPGLNPEGVGLREPFQTPAGPKQRPTAHVQCRCAFVVVVLPSEGPRPGRRLRPLRTRYASVLARELPRSSRRLMLARGLQRSLTRAWPLPWRRLSHASRH